MYIRKVKSTKFANGVLKTEREKKGFFSLCYDRGIHDDKNGGDRRQKGGGRIQDSGEGRWSQDMGILKRSWSTIRAYRTASSCALLLLPIVLCCS